MKLQASMKLCRTLITNLSLDSIWFEMLDFILCFTLIFLCVSLMYSLTSQWIISYANSSYKIFFFCYSRCIYESVLTYICFLSSTFAWCLFSFFFSLYLIVIIIAFYCTMLLLSYLNLFLIIEIKFRLHFLINVPRGY